MPLANVKMDSFSPALSSGFRCKMITLEIHSAVQQTFESYFIQNAKINLRTENLYIPGIHQEIKAEPTNHIFSKCDVSHMRKQHMRKGVNGVFRSHPSTVGR